MALVKFICITAYQLRMGHLMPKSFCKYMNAIIINNRFGLTYLVKDISILIETFDHNRGEERERERKRREER